MTKQFDCKRHHAKKPEHRVKQAVALQYHQDKDNAVPEITAKGDAEVAEEIIRLALENQVMTHEDPLLTEALAQFEVGTEIPPALYTLIAELIAFSYVLQGKFPDHWDGHTPVDTRV